MPTQFLIGALARIRTRFGLLCCEPLPGQPWAAQHAWVGVTATTGGLYWAQTGYRKWRHNGVIRTARYWEVNGSTYNITYGPAPAQNSTHTYACELISPSPGTNALWQFRYDGAMWGQFNDPVWTGFAFMGNRADYTGEIHNFEDDMPGSAANTCLFSVCQFRRLDPATVRPRAWEPTNLAAGNVSSDNPAKWGARLINARSFEIWDVARG